ncbi:MAG: response regulator transcription factor, partial [Microcystaceae cyanobacterium]
MFVDDELAFEQAIKQKFRKEIKSGEYEIIFVHSGEEALNAIELDRERQIDLLLTDLRMPAAKVDGFKLIRALRERRIYLKTIVISAYGDMENYRQAIRENILLFLTKPIDILELKPLIEEALTKPDQIDVTSKKVRFNTISRLVNELPSQQKGKLIDSLIESLELEELEKLQENFPDRLNNQLEIARKRKEEKELLIAKLRRGEIDLETPLELLERHYIEEKYIPKSGKTFGPYYYLRWWEDGRLKTK